MYVGCRKTIRGIVGTYTSQAVEVKQCGREKFPAYLHCCRARCVVTASCTACDKKSLRPIPKARIYGVNRFAEYIYFVVTLNFRKLIFKHGRPF